MECRPTVHHTVLQQQSVHRGRNNFVHGPQMQARHGVPHAHRRIPGADYEHASGALLRRLQHQHAVPRDPVLELDLALPERVPHQAAVLGADEDAAPRRFQALHELPQVDHAEQRQVVVQVLAHLRLERTYQQVELLGFRGRPRGQRRDGAVGDVQGGGDGAVPRVYEEDVAALGRGQHGVVDGLKRTDSIRKFTTKRVFLNQQNVFVAY
jgi:hypothetical protein